MEFEDKAIKFMSELPYRNKPYSGRNWGHSWHSLCSYHGKLKPAIAHILVSEFSNPGDTILDPLCGVGTIPFEACLQGRIGIGNDLSEMAYVVSKAKLERPTFNDVKKVLSELSAYIEDHSEEYSGHEYENFGFNGKLLSYFEQKTYKELLAARSFLVPKIPRIKSSEAMVYAALLHVLHGNRPYALSRKSHPLTPYAPSGEFEYKSVIEKVSQKIINAYKEDDFANFVLGKAYLGDYSDLSKKEIKADCIITSPPFADSMRFYMQNWMRLWMCGWEPQDYKNADVKFLDKQQRNNFDLYYDFFKMCYTALSSNGKVILHLGKTKNVDMGLELSTRATQWFNVIYLASEDVSQIEKHGVKDKGATFEHQFLFLEKK